MGVPFEQQTSRDVDASLGERFRRGDAEAFERIVREHGRTVYLLARRLLRSHDDADEAAQRAFVRAWKARRTFRGASSIGTWLGRIALNTARSMIRSRRLHEPLERLDRLADGTPGSDEFAGRREARDRVRRAVAGLPPRQREAVLLKVFGEMTCRETAEVMGVSEGAVKAHLHQAVSNLRRRMRPDGREAGS
jgi:RNA polymerase sigma-70 factor (ECF subfamily)